MISRRSSSSLSLERFRPGRFALALGVLLAAAAPAAGEGILETEILETVDVGPAWSSYEVPSDDVLEARGAVFGEVTVITGDVFDPETPGENSKVYRLTNRLHRTTRPGVIRSQLLFREGQAFSRQALEESERLLRRLRYLYDAEIHTVRYRNNRVDVEVRTRDVWTLSPGFSLGRSGGENTSEFKLQDDNLLGSGRSLTFKHRSDIDRDTLFVRYEDYDFLSRRMRLKLHYGDATDGGVRRFEIFRPFYSLDSRKAAGFSYFENDRVDSLFTLGELVDHFQHHETRIEVHGGLSTGLRGGRARRFTAGVRYEEHRFGPSLRPPFDPTGPQGDDLSPNKGDDRGSGGIKPKDDDVDPFEPSGYFPDGRTLIYPWIGFESVGNRYEEARLLDQMGRTEDLELGLRYRVRLGYASEAFGGDRDAAIFDAGFRAGFRPTGRQILLLDGEASGRWGKDGAEDVHVGAQVRFYWRNFGRHLFYVNIEGDVVENLDPEHQLLLGGDSGLRGYPLRYQDGDKRLLVSLEQRFFTDFYPFRLFYVGGAVFLDLGQTWGDGMTGSTPLVPLDRDLGLLRNAGFGLRLSSSRSGEGSVIHLDVAFPLDGDDSIQSVQWLVSTKKTF